jgi:hypothetical protein
MPYRAMALVAASLLFATQSYAETAVKSSKSNSSERMGGGGGGKGAAGVTTRGPRGGVAAVGRMGGGGGGKGASGNAVNLNSSRSN